MSKKTVKKTATPKSTSIAKSKFWLWKLVAIFTLITIAWLIYLDASVRYKFEGKRWALPAQVYARPLEIFEGQALNLDNLEQELSLLGYRAVSEVRRPGEYIRQGNHVEIYRRSHDNMEGRQAALRLSFLVQGDVIQTVSVENSGAEQGIYTLEPYKMGGIYPQSREERMLLAYEDVPPELVAALLSTEDRDFFTHYGVSPLSIARAMFANVKAGRVVQGGSTLTQQLVKNFYLSRERSIVRKVNEALMALMLELHYTKEDILETYINDIYLGQSGATAIHGFAMASRFYFAQNIEDLSVENAALLVGILKGPSYYDPRRHPKRARDRRNLVLSLMHEQGWMSKPSLLQAQQQALQVTSKPSFKSNRYPAFIDLVKRQLSEEYNAEDLNSEGLQIYTTLDPQLQNSLERAVKQETKRIIGRGGNDKLEAGAVVTAVGTGEVQALIGGKNPQYKGFNRALDAYRPVGSLIKPAIYLAALERPNDYQLASTIKDEAFVLEFQNGDVWQPGNFDGELHGDVALVEALANSYNLAAARLGLELGLDTVKDSLRRLGVTRELNPYPSLLLGAQTMSPFDVAKFYQTIASNGFNMPLRAIRQVTSHKGELLSRYRFEVEQVISPQASYLLQSGMQEAMRNGTGKSAYKTLPTQLLTAGKTGTTNDFRDSWFAGFSGDYLGVFWVGKDDNTPTGLTGGSGALRLWTNFMSTIPQYPLATPRPSDVDIAWFDQDTYKQTTSGCVSAQPLPVWGDYEGFEWQDCARTTNRFKTWVKSWLQF